MAPSRTAAIGSTRVARRAGRRLATTVTMTPTTIETITVRVLTTVPLLGSVRPAALNSANSPWARPRPASRPTTEATNPTASDSIRIERSTCRREAPSVRRVANSRVRWAIVIESELAITKLPTNRATPAKTSRNVFRKERKPVVAEASLVACWAPVRTWVSSGSTVRISATSRWGLTPGLGADADVVELAELAEQALRGREIKPGQGGPADRARAFRSGPALRSASTPPGRSPGRRSRSPGRRFFLAAVLVSTTTSAGPGQWPLTSFSELNWGRDGSTLKPRLGAPPKEIAWPFLISWGLPGNATEGVADVGQAPDTGQQRFREGWGRRGVAAHAAAARAGVDRVAAGDGGIGASVHGLEDRPESVVDRVGEDIGAGHQRHPQHDRERRQRGAQPPCRDALERDPEHRLPVEPLHRVHDLGLA